MGTSTHGQFLDEWPALLDTVGSRQMTYVTTSSRTIAGSDLVPE